VSQENLSLSRKKDNEPMQGYVDVSMGNYVVLDQEQHDVSEIKE
jgi:hypothetical protein